MNRIRQLREEKHFGQSILADLLGLEVSAISKLEKGKVPLRDEYIIKLAEFFDVSTDYLLGTTEIRNNYAKDDDALVAFYGGYKDLDDEDKKIILATIKSMKKKNKNK